MDFIKYIRERRRSIREAVGRQARAEAEQSGQGPTYTPPNRAARRRYWKVTSAVDERLYEFYRQGEGDTYWLSARE